VKRHSWYLVALWTGCVGGSLVWNLHEHRARIFEIARNSAQVTFENDILYRKWAARQGGVYVKVAENAPPNPFLRIPDRDVTTTTGTSLTLVNPAYMARQANEMAQKEHGNRGHLTSLKPLRPENGPDPWEAAALKSFATGVREVVSFDEWGGEERLRLMRPFVTEKPCLKCHESQGFKEGDVQGGISVSVPMGPLWAIQKPQATRMTLGHLLLWMVGLAGLAASRRSLGKEVLARERTEESLQQSEAQLREADRRKNEFLALLSHELRNPLTPIRNSLYILDRVAPGDQSRRAKSVIDRQVAHLARLVDDLLDITRITRGKIRLQRGRLDLADGVRRALEDHRSLLEGHRVSVELPDEAVWVDGDPTRLAQVIGNLLGNARKFTPTGGLVRLSLAKRGGMAVLEISDSGEGIEAVMLERLFEPFAQAERTLARSRGGLGLGLSLVKGIVELHGGKVEAHSDGPDRGARFTVSLPLDEQQAAVTVAARESQGMSHSQKKVLIIEDNTDAADSLCEALELAGYRVAVAYSSADGLATARDFVPEVVLCDIGLPHMDGYAVARALRQEVAVASAFLVALTGYALPEDQQRAREAGFNAHLAKPADLTALGRLLAQAPVGASVAMRANRGVK
jgi:two-component system CheB/CheR fusion protein